ncbi:MAG TPA: ribosome maturation factor RimM [Candidatus Acidoferrum sp.]|nr:ribosome maturation factor RimM [Candidatus Acidoferrum sp.]
MRRARGRESGTRWKSSINGGAGNRTIRDPETSGEFITLARVVKTQGRRGEVASEVLSDIPERFTIGMRLLALPREAQGQRRDLEVEELWPHKGLLVLKFLGVDSISEAETLVGCELQVPRSQRSELQDGWNYVSDLVGCTVLDDGREIGRIEDVQFGAGEAPLLIVREASARLVEVPFAQAYLDRVDVERKQVLMKLPEGLLEVNAPLSAEEKREQPQGGGRRRSTQGTRRSTG